VPKKDISRIYTDLYTDPNKQEVSPGPYPQSFQKRRTLPQILTKQGRKKLFSDIFVATAK